MIVFQDKNKYNFYDLVEIIALLRSPGGCPWDAEQTHESIKKNLIEETYEVIEAINKADSAMLREELGDLMMQVVLHADMAKQNGEFVIDDVADEVCKKLILRHPHVFSDIEVHGVEEVLSNWDEIKKKTKGFSDTGESMKAVARELPALMRSDKVQKRAADVGFDWPTVNGAFEKLQEEVQELKEALESNNLAAIEEELGDVFFSAVNVSRFCGYDAEEVLTAATDKFIKRFTKLESMAKKQNINLREQRLDFLNLLWDLAKDSLE